jgi:2'-5' RNA ligase
LRLAAAYQRVWDEFRHNATTQDGRHDTPSWRAHSGPFAACVVRVPGDALQPNLDAFRRELAVLDCVRRHPDNFLHIMIQELGFVGQPPLRADEISADRLEEFAQSAVDPVSRMPSFRIGLGGANSFRDAVFLEVTAGEPLAHLHGRLFDLAAVTYQPEYPYLPHCTIGHYLGTAPVEEPFRAIAPWRTVLFGEITVTEVEIVSLASRSAYPELESYAVIPLAT